MPDTKSTLSNMKSSHLEDSSGFSGDLSNVEISGVLRVRAGIGLSNFF